MTTSALSAQAAVSHGIQVSGLKCFPSNEWRNAILHYLFGMWGGNENVTYRPKITFGLATLRLDCLTQRYFAYGPSPDQHLPDPDDEHTLVVGDGRNEVDVGLVTFVKNVQITRLVIRFPDQTEFWLWKKERRGEFGCMGLGIPPSLGDVR